MNMIERVKAFEREDMFLHFLDTLISADYNYILVFTQHQRFDPVLS